MPSEADFVSLPEEFRAYRDDLRVVGYELVRYSVAHARAVAARYRHPTADYEYAIHKIECIQAEDYQVFINRHPFYSSAERVPDWVRHYVEKERPQGFGVVKSWFKDPAHALLTLVVPPYGLTLLGLAAAGDRMSKSEQQRRRQLLNQLSEMPKFLLPYGA